MKIYKKGNIVSVWDKIIDKNQHYKLGMEVKENIIYKIVMITLYNIIMNINMIIFNKINNIKININP